MDIGLFVEKLRSLNRNLYVDFNHRVKSDSEVGTSGIYLRGVHGEPIKTFGYASKEASDLRESDKYVAWTQHGWVPEGDIFSEEGRVKCHGWRTIVKRLLASGITTKKKAEKAFGYVESFYDKMNYEERLKFHLLQQ